MSSSSSDGGWAPRAIRSFELHDMAEAGDVEGLRRLLHRPPAPSRRLAADDDGGDDNADGDVSDDEDFNPDSAYVSFDIEEKDGEGLTPLHAALLGRQLEAARLLLDAGANVNKKVEHSSPLHIVVALGAFPHHRAFAADAVALLLQHGADPTFRDDRTHTPLHVAAALGVQPCLQALLATAAAQDIIELRDRVGARPLQAAASNGHVAAVSSLLAAGATPLAADYQGSTALHAACARGRWSVARVLLDACPASAAALNKRGRTPGQAAQFRGLKVPDTLRDELLPAVTEAGGDAPEGAADGPLAAAAAAAGGSQAAALSVGSEDGEECTTVIIRHELCLQHHSCLPFRRYARMSSREGPPPPPPENVNRLKVIYDPELGVLSSSEFAALRWEDRPPRAQIADVLRVHEYTYVDKIQRLCLEIEPPFATAELDSDTVVSRRSFEAAMRAAGAVTSAVDKVMSGQNRNAFCAVRPPGHHAGPRGVVTCGAGDRGSHGFCLLNNVAIGAAYARHVYRAQGINKVAIVDFDVHHGNGTEEIVRWLVPASEEAKVQLGPFCSGTVRSVSYKPWVNEADPASCLFVSIHGYGVREHPPSSFYPGSGATCIPSMDRIAQAAAKADAAAAPVAAPAAAAPAASAGGPSKEPGGAAEAAKAAAGEPAGGAKAAANAAGKVERDEEEEDEEMEDAYEDNNEEPEDDDEEEEEMLPPRGAQARAQEPLVFDVGMGLSPSDEPFGASRVRWRDVLRRQVLPALARYKPDFILVSAGFDAHRKDLAVNTGFIGLVEEDYEWVTAQLVAVANGCCDGRIVSVLEGGYHIQGGPVSAFGRSVASHVRALVDGCRSREIWSPAEAAAESELENAQLAERERKRRLKAQAQAMADLQRIRQQELLFQAQIAQMEKERDDGDAEGGGGSSGGGGSGGGGGGGSGGGGSGGTSAEDDEAAVTAPKAQELNGGAAAGAPAAGAGKGSDGDHGGSGGGKRTRESGEKEAGEEAATTAPVAGTSSNKMDTAADTVAEVAPPAAKKAKAPPANNAPAAAVAAAAAMAPVQNSSAGSGSGGGGGGGDSHSRRRRRGNVDYVGLAKQLDAEVAASKGSSGASDAKPPAGTLVSKPGGGTAAAAAAVGKTAKGANGQMKGGS